MRILHIDSGREWRGGQRQCWLLHTGLIQRGYESFLLCREGGELAKKNAPNTFTFPMRGEINPKFSKFIVSFVKKHKIDIVHTHDAHAHTPALLARLFTPFHLMHTRRVDFTVKKNPVSLYKYKNRFTTVVSISQGVKRILVRDGIPAESIPVVYSGVPHLPAPDMAQVEKLREEMQLSGRFVIGQIANISPHKDHATLIRAFARAAEANPALTLLLVGDGPLLDSVKRQAEATPCRDRIIFTGFRKDLSEMLSLMDIYTVTSNEEGLNTSIIDALNMGLPVVATNAGGIGELVRNEQDGFLCPVADDKAIAESFLTLAHDAELRRQYSETARVIGKEFSNDAMVEGYISLYTQKVGS